MFDDNNWNRAPGPISTPGTPSKGTRPLSTNQNTGSYDPAVQFGNMDIKSNEYEGFGDELIVDSALQEELVIRQKWSSYRVLEGGESEESAPGIGEYRDVLDNEPHTIVLKRPDGRLEPSESYVGRDARGQARSLQLFPGAAIVDEDAFADWMRISAACPFAANLFDAFLDNGSLCLVYELDGSAVSMASALRTSAIDGGFIASSKAAEEALMEQWLAQLLWTIRLVHQEQQWFIGAQLLGNPQNILLSSQNHRLRIHGLGAVQLLALARSPLEYTASEIRAQQLQDLKALSDLLKNFLSGPRRWLVRSPLFAPILAFLDQRLALSVTPVTDLLLLPASQNLLQKLFLASFRRQDFLEHQMMLQIQSERVLGLLTRLIYVTERFKSDDNLKSWPSRTPLLLFHNYLFGPKNIPGIPDMDLLHVMGIMRQVDLCSDERILLTRDDSAASLVVSFAEIAYHIEETYEALQYES